MSVRYAFAFAAFLSTSLSGAATAQTQKLSPDYLAGTWRIDGLTGCQTRYTKISVYGGDRKEADYIIAPGGKIVLLMAAAKGARVYHWVRIVDHDHFVTYRITSNTGAPTNDHSTTNVRC